MNPVIQKFMNGDSSVEEYLDDISKITPYLEDENDKDTLINELPYLRNFLDEYKRNPTGENTLNYYRAIRDSGVAKEYIPQDIRQNMDAELDSRK
jgi:hypothetical protein